MDTSPSHVGVELNVRALIKYTRDPKFNPQRKEAETPTSYTTLDAHRRLENKVNYYAISKMEFNSAMKQKGEAWALRRYGSPCLLYSPAVSSIFLVPSSSYFLQGRAPEIWRM